MENYKFYTPNDIANIMGVTERTVRDWVRKGKLKGIRLTDSKGVRISQQDLDKFIEDNQVKTA